MTAFGLQKSMLAYQSALVAGLTHKFAWSSSHALCGMQAQGRFRAEQVANTNVFSEALSQEVQRSLQALRRPLLASPDYITGHSGPQMVKYKT